MSIENSFRIITHYTPVIEILPEDYGIWFVDAMDHPETYEGKTVKFKARVMKPRGMGSKFFVPGRTAMTCCADDTTFLGYVCKSAFAPKLNPGQWVEVTAKDIRIKSALSASVRQWAS